MPDLRHVLIAAHGINQIDSYGVDTLARVVQTVRESGREISFSGFSDSVLDLVKRFHFYEVIGEENIYPTQVLAVRHIYADAHSDSKEESCPLAALRPQVAELSLHPDGSLRDARRHGLAQCEHIAVLRFDGPLDRASSAYLMDKVEERVSNMPKLKHVLFACHRINQIDAHGAEVLRKIVRWLRDSGYEVAFSDLADDVLDILKETGVYEVIGEESIHPTQVQAIRYVYSSAHAESVEAACPLASARPYLAELSLHSDGSFHDAHRYGLKRCENIAALRFDGSLDLASAEYLESRIEHYIANMPHLKHVFFAAHRMNKIEASGVEVLGKVVKRLRDSGYEVSFSGLTDDVLDMLKSNHLYETIGENNIYPTQAVAIEQIHGRAHQDSEENPCPLLQVVPLERVGH